MTSLLPLAGYNHAKVGQFLNWVDLYITASLEAVTILVEQRLQQSRLIVEHAAIEHDIMAAGHDVDGIDLNYYAGSQRRGHTCLAAPAATGIQALLPKQKFSAGPL